MCIMVHQGQTQVFKKSQLGTEAVQMKMVMILVRRDSITPA